MWYNFTQQLCIRNEQIVYCLITMASIYNESKYIAETLSLNTSTKHNQRE